MEQVVCGSCGQTAAEVPLTWIASIENGRKVLYCDRCSRENLRAIESKLDPVWW